MLEFVSAPSNTLQAQSYFLQDIHSALDMQYSMLIDIKPTIPIERGGRIIIQMIDDDYVFTGDFCTS
jgi:hypothetical protein